MLKPRLDASAFLAVPRGRVEAVETPMEGDVARAVRMAAAGVLEDEPDVSPEEADEYSAARAAAAAVTARLQRLVSAEAEPEEPILEGPDSLPDVGPFPADDVVVDIRSAVDAQADPGAPEAGLLSADYGLGGLQDADPQAQLPEEPRRTGPYMMLGFMGVVFWILALVVVFRTPGDGAVGAGASAVGWTLGLVGLACVGGALWFLLAPPEPPLPEGLSTEDRTDA